MGILKKKCLTNVSTITCIYHVVYTIDHAIRTFEFINTSPLQERAFVLQNVASLKTFPLDFTNIMCLSTIDKYIKIPTYLSNISLIEFVTNYASVNLRAKRNFFHIILFCAL